MVAMTRGASAQDISDNVDDYLYDILTEARIYRVNRGWFDFGYMIVEDSEDSTHEYSDAETELYSDARS